MSQVQKRRATRDCLGRPASSLSEKLELSRRPSEQGVAGAQQAPVILRVLGLRVDFLSDRAGSQTTSEGGKFDLRRGTGEFIDPPPHNRDYFSAHLQAVARYYSAMSNGQIIIQWDVFPSSPDTSFHLSDTADYGPWTYSDADFQLAERLITDAVQAADNSAEPITFSQYDIVLLFHAGSDLQGDINNDSPYDIPSFTAGLEHPVPVDGGTSYVYAATVLPETVSQDGLTGALNGVTVHETGHMLGLPDLYNTDDFLPSVGYWSLMDTGNYLGGYVEDPATHELVFVFGLLPGGLDAYCRRELGRVFGIQTEEEVNVDRLWADTLRAVETSSRVLNVPLSASEYYMIENRESELDGNGATIVNADTLTGVILGPASNEYDALLPGSGILVWHVDENVISSRAALGMSPNGSRPDRGIALKEADGIEDLGDPSSWEWLGSEFDPYFVGNATLLTPETVPNSDANSGATSHVFVSVTSSRSVGMYVQAERKWARQGWPVAARANIGSVLGFGDFDSDGTSEVFLAGTDSTLRAWTAAGGTYLPGQSDGLFARAPGSLIPVVCYSAGASALAATVKVDGAGRLYAWAVNDAHAPTLPGQVLAGWPAPTPPVTTSPCAIGDEIIAGCSDGRVYAVLPSGNVTWTGGAPSGLPVTGSIAAGDLDRDGHHEVAFSAGHGSVFCVSSADGADFFPPFPLPAEAASDTAGPYLLMADVDGRPDSTLDVLVTLQSGRVFALDVAGDVMPGWPVSLGDSVLTWPSAGDVDGDGLAELVVRSAGGRLYVVNGDGVVSSGWPFPAEGSRDTVGNGPGSDAAAAISLADLNGDAASELVFRQHDSELSALTGARAAVQGWPVSTGAPVCGSMGVADLEAGSEPDGFTELFVPLGDSLLWCFELPQPVSATEWPVLGRSGSRINSLDNWTSHGARPGEGLIVGGDVYAQPNPSRDSATSIRFSLSAAGAVSMEVFDLSGRKVFSFRGAGFPTENEVIWQHGAATAGVYVVRLEVQAQGRKDVAFCRASVIH
jgi:M6 family metalloprotease-like protein